MILCLVPILVLLLAFFVLPFGVMFYESLFLSPLQAPAGSRPTLANYTKLFGDLFYLKVLLQTLGLGVVVTAAHPGHRVSRRVPSGTHALALAAAPGVPGHFAAGGQHRHPLLRLDGAARTRRGRSTRRCRRWG